ncbi:hypothetical protein SAMN05216604_10783 [Pseudomonas agarici]|nr:hypothetical protein SAMN05216604_10783 [Pseudomonas agarici]
MASEAFGDATSNDRVAAVRGMGVDCRYRDNRHSGESLNDYEDQPIIHYFESCSFDSIPCRHRVIDPGETSESFALMLPRP